MTENETEVSVSEDKENKDANTGEKSHVLNITNGFFEDSSVLEVSKDFGASVGKRKKKKQLRITFTPNLFVFFTLLVS